MVRLRGRSVALLFALVGCESDADELRRLQLSVDTARLRVLRYEAAIDSIEGRGVMLEVANETERDVAALRSFPPQMISDSGAAFMARSSARGERLEAERVRATGEEAVAAADSVRRLLREAEIRRDLASRDLNRFMRE